MNLLAAALPAVTAVNPQQTLVGRRSSGWGTNAAGRQVPLYDVPITGPGQVQPVTSGDLKHMMALNLQGNFKALYLFGRWAGVVRVGRQGGDLFGIDGQVWLVVNQSEEWPDWTRVVVQLQQDPDLSALFGFREMSATQPPFGQAPMRGAGAAP